MDKFSELRAFTAVVDAGGFSAAGRDLGQSRSSVNRLVIALEKRLNLQLLHRTTRSVAATSAGRAFYERAKALLDDLDELESSAAAAGAEPVGKIRLSAPPEVGILDFPQLILEFMARYPRVEIDASFDTRLVDLIAEGYDLALRVAPPDETTPLVDHRIFEITYCLCASSRYLEGRATPSTPADLADHALLYQGSSRSRPTWRLLGPKGEEMTPVRPALATNSVSAILAAVRAGQGIGIVPTHEVRVGLRNGDLRRVLPEYCTAPRMLQVIYPPSRHLSERVRLFTRFVAETCNEIAPA